MKVIKINESQKKRLFESATSILYHYLNLEYLVDVLKNNALRTCEPERYLNVDDEKTEYINGKDVRFISLTRNGNPSEGYPIIKYGEFGDGELSCICRLTIDGNALNIYSNFKDKNGKRQNMKVKPIDWAYYDIAKEHGATNGKEWMMHSDDTTYIPNAYYDNMLSSEDDTYKYGDIEYSDLYHHPYSQAEDRLLTTAKYIPNANKYIKKIDIYTRGDCDDQDVIDDLDEQMGYINEIYELAKRLGIPCYVHNEINSLRYGLGENKIFEGYQNGFSFDELTMIADSAFGGEDNSIPQMRYCTKWLGYPMAMGSSRAVYTLSDNLVLKLAYGNRYFAGIDQNRAEYELYQKVNSPLVAKIFYHDKNFTYLVSENVLPCSEEDFEKILGIPFHHTYYQNTPKVPNSSDNGDAEIGFNNYFDDLKQPFELSELSMSDILMWIECNYVIDEPYNDMRIQEAIKKSQWLQDFVKLVQETKMSDFVSLENFGMVNRDGKPMIVVLDSGLNLDVWEKHYKQ